MEGMEAAPKEQRTNKSKNKKKETEKTNDDGMKEAVEAIDDAVIQKAKPIHLEARTLNVKVIKKHPNPRLLTWIKPLLNH
jgi:hypothetical protein